MRPNPQETADLVRFTEEILWQTSFFVRFTARKLLNFPSQLVLLFQTFFFINQFHTTGLFL